MHLSSSIFLMVSILLIIEHFIVELPSEVSTDFFLVRPKKPNTVLFIDDPSLLYYWGSYSVLIFMLGQFCSYFLLGAFFRLMGGNPKGMAPPSFIKGWSKI